VHAVLGTIPGWLTLAILILGAWRITKGGAGTAVSELNTANEVLTRRVHELGDENKELRREVSELRGRTDVAVAIMPIIEWTMKHENRAQERHDSAMTILGLIADRLGPEPNGD
jgi:hypothetical protein